MAMTLKSALAAIGLISALLLVFPGPAPAATMACPAKTTQSKDVVAALNAAKGCDVAIKVFDACQYGASGDTEFGDIVQKKCEADFLDKASGSKKQDYTRALGVCDRKYRNKAGSIYISFAAFCRAEAAQRFSKEMRKAAGAK
jgi:hypothetical protein